MMNGKTMTIAMAQMARKTIIAARALFCFAHSIVFSIVVGW